MIATGKIVDILVNSEKYWKHFGWYWYLAIAFSWLVCWWRLGMYESIFLIESNENTDFLNINPDGYVYDYDHQGLPQYTKDFQSLPENLKQFYTLKGYRYASEAWKSCSVVMISS